MLVKNTFGNACITLWILNNGSDAYAVVRGVLYLVKNVGSAYMVGYYNRGYKELVNGVNGATSAPKTFTLLLTAGLTTGTGVSIFRPGCNTWTCVLIFCRRFLMVTCSCTTGILRLQAGCCASQVYIIDGLQAVKCIRLFLNASRCR